MALVARDDLLPLGVRLGLAVGTPGLAVLEVVPGELDRLGDCVHSACSRLCDIRPPEARELPGGVALERLRVLDTWVDARRTEPLSGTGVHELLTHVVDEVHGICETLGREMLGAPAA